MVTVRQLIDALEQFCKPEDDVIALHSHYDGGSEVYRELDPVLVVGQTVVFIVADDYYDKRHAQKLTGHAYFTTVNIETGKWTE